MSLQARAFRLSGEELIYIKIFKKYRHFWLKISAFNSAFSERNFLPKWASMQHIFQQAL